ncbi:MAG: hypothetical protein AMXMBFR64_06770 [Myxococcales bacterium]
MRLDLWTLAAVALLAVGCDNDYGTTGWAIASGTDGTTSGDGSSGADASGADSGPGKTDAVADTGGGSDGDAADAADGPGDAAQGDATLEDAVHGDAGSGDASSADAVQGEDVPPTEDTPHIPPDVATDATAACEPTTTFLPSPGAAHVTEPPSYPTYPPSAGDHYAVWSAWGVANGVVPAAHFVHNLEHGGIVFLYRCDTPCPELVAELQAFVATLPPEPLCDAVDGVQSRFVLTEDPCLPDGITIAALAWEWSLTASCLDTHALEHFVEEHQGKAPESTCAHGGFVATPEDPPVVCPAISP